MNVAIVHDYLTQRGGAERVVLAMQRAFPGAALYTSVYDPDGTFDEFRALTVRTTALNRLPLFRRQPRTAFPLYPAAFGRLRLPERTDVVLMSSSGWSHGAASPRRARRVVYCYSPPKWLHQPERYFGDEGQLVARVAVALLGRRLRAWDVSSAHRADLYLTQSTYTQGLIRDAYGIDSVVVPPPVTIDVSAERRPVAPLEDREFLLCVSRLLPYKRVGSLVEAMRRCPATTLVIVGSGPQLEFLRALAPPNVLLLGAVDDRELRWLYTRCTALVSAADEDFGLTPIEAACFGKPSLVPHGGGFVDTVVDGWTGRFLHSSSPDGIARAVACFDAGAFDSEVIRDHARRYSEQRFRMALRAAALDVLD